MSVHPADSEIYGALWGTAEMRALFSDATQLQLMLDVEAALARAEAKLGLVPQQVAEAITKAARVENLRIERIAEGTRETGVPVPALVSELGRAAGEEAARYIHLGATTQDILDTALVLQVRRALEYLRRDLVALARTLARTRERVSRHADGRSDALAAGGADNLWAQVRGMGVAARRSRRTPRPGGAPRAWSCNSAAPRERSPRSARTESRWPRRSRTSLASACRICRGMSRATRWPKLLRCWDWYAAASPSSRSTCRC